MKYELGHTFKGCFKITELDPNDEALGYKISVLGLPNEYYWASDEDIVSIKEQADPQLRKLRVQQEIEALQKQLEEIK